MQPIAIIIPYCGRREHLASTLPILLDYNPDARPWVIVVEQVRSLIKDPDPDVPGKQLYPFNRGLLCNLGARIALDEQPAMDVFCFHDVDMQPIGLDVSVPVEPDADADPDADPPPPVIEEHPVPYEVRGGYPAALVGSRRDAAGNTQPVAPGYFGGVVMFRRKDLMTVGGFSNQYWGWGDEDLDLRMRVEWAGFDRIDYKGAKFQHLDHPPIINREQLIENHKRLGKTQDRLIKPADDGLATMPTMEPVGRSNKPGGTDDRPTRITHVQYAVHRPGIEKEWNDNAAAAAADVESNTDSVLDGLGISPG